jgi:hypothetical protein
MGLRRDSADMGDLDLTELPVTPGCFDPDAFGELHRRHQRSIAGFLMRRAGTAELAADLTAEVFAAALLAWRRARRRLTSECDSRGRGRGRRQDGSGVSRTGRIVVGEPGGPPGRWR